MQKPNLLLTGAPGVGKTTAIMRTLKTIDLEAQGFYTREIKEKGKRKGFAIVTLDGREAPLAHVDFPGPPNVGKYGVDMRAMINLAVTALEVDQPGDIMIVDEIGPMECASSAFCGVVSSLLDGSYPVLGTISRRGGEFIDEVKKRKDVEIWEVTTKNRNQIPDKIVGHLKKANLI